MDGKPNGAGRGLWGRLSGRWDAGLAESAGWSVEAGPRGRRVYRDRRFDALTTDGRRQCERVA